MNQNLTIDSDTQLSKTPGLKPALATALGSLEVQLDQELTRYRRARNGIRQTKQVGVENYISYLPQQLNTITEAVEKTQPSVSEIKTKAVLPENPTLQLDNHEEINDIPISSSQESRKIQTPPPQPNTISSIVPTTKVKAVEGETLVTTNNPPKYPDDYLESSEALLRSLQEEKTQTKKPRNSGESLVSPVGIGSILMVLLASLTLGYVVFHPQTLPRLDLSKLFNRVFSLTSENTQVAENNSSPHTSPIDQPEIKLIPKYPNLAAREFPEARDLNDVIGLKPKVKPTPTVIPQPITIEASVNPVLPPASVPNVSPIPKPTETLAELNTQIKPSDDGYYYIVADNQGDNALAQARQVISDAYLSDGQKHIYLGAFKTEEEAKQRLQQLQAKGIKARVRKP